MAACRDGGPQIREAAMADDTTTEQTADDTTEEVVEPTESEDSATETSSDDEGKLGNPGKAALAEERKARREAERAKRESDRARRDLEKKLQEIRDKDKSDAEKAAARAEDAEKRVAGLLVRAVRAEVRARAAEKFADPEDAIAFLDLASYTDEEGEIDEEQIKADLASLLERKPHLAKQTQAEPEKRRPPAPDRSQASSANKSRTSSPEEVFGAFLQAQRK